MGVGTKTPSSRLEVEGVLKARHGVFTNTQANSSTFSSVGDRNDKCHVFGAGSVIGTGSGYLNTRMLNFYDFPSSNIDAKSTAFFSIVDRDNYSRYRVIAETDGTTNMVLMNKSQEAIFQVYEDGSDDVRLTLPKEDSYLGIGTTSFTDGTDVYRLSVNGNIRATRVKVYNTWADFVFENDYLLPTLAEVEQHIKEKGHLKDIPSAEEVEANGIDLGEMNKKLLQKVEELTLYLIEMNKKVEALEAKVKN